MSYRLILYRGLERDECDQTLSSLADAQNVAKERINSGKFDCVEIVNEAGTVCLRHREHEPRPDDGTHPYPERR
jgi:hypothetical protein